MTSETNGDANGAGEQHYLLYVWAGVDPELRGPYASDAARLKAARALAADGGADEHGIFWVDASGAVEVGTFGAAEVEG